MSISLMVSVMERMDVSRPEQIVLMAMADHADDEGRNCYPSIDKIAWKTGYRRRAVQEILSDLKKRGVVEVVSAGAGSSPQHYEIHVNRAAAKITFEKWKELFGKKRGAENAPIEEEENQEQGCIPTVSGVHSGGLGVHSGVQAPRENAPKPSPNLQEPPKNPLGDYISLSENLESDPTKPHTQPKKRDSDGSESSKFKYNPKYNPEDLDFANWMFTRIKRVAPSARSPSLAGWANDIRIMRERDKLTLPEMAEIFKWANEDSFWRTNILSPSKLREKWNQLSAKREAQRGNSTSGIQQTGTIRGSGTIRDQRLVAQPSDIADLLAKRLEQNGFGPANAGGAREVGVIETRRGG